MAIACHCLACDSSFNVHNKMAGKLGKCPRCGEPFRVPGERDSASSSVDMPQPQLGPGAGTPPISQPGPSTRSAPAAPAARTAAGRRSSVASRFAREHASQRVPIWAWFGGGGLMLAAIVGVIVAVQSAIDTPSAEKSSNGTTPGKNAPEESRPASDVGGNGPVPDVEDPYAPRLLPDGPKTEVKPTEKPKPGASLEEYARYAEHAIVKLDVYSDDWNQMDSLGSGFIIDVKQRLVVTNYHVLRTAVKAGVKFNNGVRYGVLGYVALKKESDLAIVQLNGLPPQATELDLRTDGDPQKLETVVSIGHPHGYEFTVTRGEVIFVAQTRELPAEAQAFLKSDGHNAAPDEVWIKHSAEINPGNSGGPVLNAQGEVLGVNTWKNRDETHGFALHAKHVAELLKHRFPEPQPLTQHYSPPKSPTVSLDDVANNLKDATKEAVAIGWTPKSKDDYKKISRFALLFTMLKDISESDAPLPNKPALRKPVDEAVEVLRKTQWKPEQFQALNRFAAEAEFSPREGHLLYGTVQKVFTNESDGRNVEMMQLGLDGTEKFVFVLVPKNGKAEPENKRLLVPGVSFGFLNVGDNPLDQKEVPIIYTKAIFRL